MARVKLKSEVRKQSAELRKKSSGFYIINPSNHNSEFCSLHSALEIHHASVMNFAYQLSLAPPPPELPPPRSLSLLELLPEELSELLLLELLGE